MRRSHMLAFVFVVSGAALVPARADTPVHAGTQAAPPVKAGDPALPQQLDGRRAVRGCAVDESCGRAADVLREFELGALPPPGGSPWIAEHAPQRSRLEGGPPRIVKKPSELKPDAPWLDQLALPDLPVRWSQRLVDYLVFYRDDPRGHAIMESWLVDQGRYRDLIVSNLRKARLPEDLLYVAMIESSYDPEELSSAGALGLWQFMPEGGKIYGLRRDRWIDERRDPLRSTIAQMDYFRDLYQRFGDWHIALAAFNVGYGAMLRSIARYNTNDFYQLCEYENGLPWETCWYTPKVLAAAIVGRNRAAFGFDKIKPTPPEVWDDVAVSGSVPFAVLARAANTSEDQIRRLNPQLKRGRTPPGEVGYVVRVPAGTQAETQRRIAELQSDWDLYDAYVVAHGERFEDVAMIHGVSVGQLKKLNDVSQEAEIEGGTVLVVPRVTEDLKTKNRAKAKAALLSSGVDQKDGEPLLVPIPDKDRTVPGKKRVFYRVVAGDALAEVAKALGVKSSDLAGWNDIDNGANIQPRMVLVAFVAPDFDADKRRVALLDETQLLVVTRGSVEHLDIAEARQGRVRSEYISPGKEKLGDIARRYGMGSHDLARINRISYDTVLEKGQKIIVYEVKDPARSQRAEEQWEKTPRARRGKIGGQRATSTANAASRPDAAIEKGDPKSDPKSDPKTDAKPTTKTDTKPTTKSDAKADVQTDAKPATKTESKSDTKTDGKSDGTSATKFDAKSGTKPDANTSPKKSDVKSDTRREHRDGPITKPGQLD